MEHTVREELESLCWSIADMPPEVVSAANANGLPWVQDIRDEARRILERKDEESWQSIAREDKMEETQYKGYTILIKHYPAFRHRRREYPEVFDYVILIEDVGSFKAYGFNSLEAAMINAKQEIDRITWSLDSSKMPDVTLD